MTKNDLQWKLKNIQCVPIIIFFKNPESRNWYLIVNLYYIGTYRTKYQFYYLLFMLFSLNSGILYLMNII